MSTGVSQRAANFAGQLDCVALLSGPVPLMSLNPLADKAESEKPQLPPIDFDERYSSSGRRGGGRGASMRGGGARGAGGRGERRSRGVGSARRRSDESGGGGAGSAPPRDDYYEDEGGAYDAGAMRSGGGRRGDGYDNYRGREPRRGRG